MVLLVFTAVLACIIILIKFKIPIGYALFIAAVFLLLLEGKPLDDIFFIFVDSIRGRETNELLAIVLSIVILGRVMDRAGSLKQMVSSVETLFPGSAIAAAIMPAVVGLLPMPGGAVFSAPMVDGVKALENEKPRYKAAVNYWYRHVWEYIWPMYPGVIMAAAISGVTITEVIKHQWPLSALAILAGAVVFRKLFFGNRFRRGINMKNPDSMARFFISIWPVISVVVLKFILGIEFVYAILITLSMTVAVYFRKLSPFAKFLKSLINIDTIILVEAVMALKYAVEVSGVSGSLVEFLSGKTMLVPVLAGSVAFAIGLLTGMTAAFVGTAFPLIAPLVKSGEGYNIAFLTYTCGFAGVMLSPTHLCLLLSGDYFRARIPDVYKLLLLPILGVATGGIIIFIIRGR